MKIIHIYTKKWCESGTKWDGKTLCGLPINQGGTHEDVIADHKAPHACGTCVSRVKEANSREGPFFGALVGAG